MPLPSLRCLLVEKLRRKVGARWPSDGVELHVESEVPEDCEVLQGLEHVAPEFGLQVYVPLGAVGEAHMDGVAANVLGWGLRR